MKKDYTPLSAIAPEQPELDFVEEYWSDQWAERRPDPQVVTRREEYRVIRPFLDGLPQGARILDGGCGLGEWTVCLSRAGFDVTGLDISAATIARLQTAFPEQRFVRGDLRRTRFTDGFFSAYFSWGAFEHFENGIGECVGEAWRILEPNGLLFVSVPFQNWRHILRDSRPLHKWDETFDQDRGYEKPQRFYQWRFTRPELQRELELRGFGVLKIVAISKDSGAGRMLRHGVPKLHSLSLPFRVARRALTHLLPAGYISHMLLAVARKR